MRQSTMRSSFDLLAILAVVLLLASSCGSTDAAPEAASSTIVPTSFESPTTSEPSSSAATATDAPVGVVSASACGDGELCEDGFLLDGLFHAVDCAAIRPDLVSTQILGRGSYENQNVTVNLINGVDPDVLVAVRLPGGLCAEDQVPKSAWSAAFPIGSSTGERLDAICMAGDLTEKQIEANRCDPDPSDVIPVTELGEPDTSEALAVVREFMSAIQSSDPSAIEMWSGYPVRSDEKDAAFSAFLRDFEWIRTVDDISIFVVPSAGFTTVPVVTVQTFEDGGHGVAFVVSTGSGDRMGMIARLPATAREEDRWIPAPGSIVEAGQVVTVAEIPVEGGARAFIDGTEITEVNVDHSSFTTSIHLPTDLPSIVILTVSMASPELPGARTIIYRSS